MDVTLIVDGANVMGSRADGWWRDRAGAMARLHGELAALAARGIQGPVPGDLPDSRGAGDAANGPGSAGTPEPGPAGASGAGEDDAPWGGDDGTPGVGDDDADGHWYPQIVLVVEGRTRKVLSLVSAVPGVQVVAARGEGDDEIADLAGRLTGDRIVITADRELRRRSIAAGARVTGPGWLIRQFG